MHRADLHFFRDFVLRNSIVLRRRMWFVDDTKNQFIMRLATREIREIDGKINIFWSIYSSNSFFFLASRSLSLVAFPKIGQLAAMHSDTDSIPLCVTPTIKQSEQTSNEPTNVCVCWAVRCGLWSARCWCAAHICDNIEPHKCATKKNIYSKFISHNN